MELNANDYNNILALLGRVPLQGLAEAEALTVLAVKIRAAHAKALQPPAEAAEAKKD